MTKSLSPRLGLQRWTDDGDAWTRSEFDQNNAQRDALILTHAQGSAASIPPPGMAGRVYYATDVAALFYDDGTVWQNLAGPREAAAVMAAGKTVGTVTAYRRRNLAAIALTMTASSVIYNNDVVFTIPAGFRPLFPASGNILARQNTPSSYGTVNIGTDGAAVVKDGGLPQGETVHGLIGPYPAEPLIPV